jgi:hypothetical protein
VISLAFKVAAATGSDWSMLISKLSGSPYSHVELWLDGPISNARCFSSREPHGAGFQQIDLSDGKLWVIVPVASALEQEASVNGYCFGCDGKIYDGVGLLGFELKNAAIHDYHAVFCSEVCADALHKCAGKNILPLEPWQISPGMLYEMAVKDFNP